MDAPMSPVHPIALTVVLTLAGEPDASVRMTKTLELACGTGLPNNIEKIT